MKLIFLYGPPAVGKYTVASELVKLTGYKLFHNHLTQDLVREIYPAFDKTRFRLVEKIRLQVFEYAASQGTDLIFTYVFTNGAHDALFINQTKQAIEKAKGSVVFIKLAANEDELLTRVEGASRKIFHKLIDRGELAGHLKEVDFSIRIHDTDFVIDTSHISPQKAAEIIYNKI